MAEQFTKDLAMLQASNLMSGAVVKGQAELLTARTKGTQQILRDFNERLQGLEQEPLTTEDQLRTINEDVTVTEEMVDLEEQLANFSSFSINVIQRQEELNKLYGGTIQALGVVGGEDAVRMANILESQRGTRVQELEKQRQLPFETQAYKQSMFQVETMKLELQEGTIQLEDLKNDREVAKLMSNILTTDEFTRMNLSFNTQTGKRKFDLNAFRDAMFLRYGHNPKFAQAWSGIDEYIRTNTQTYRPQFSTGTGSGANMMENLTLIKGKYTELVDATRRMGSLRFGEEYQWARDEYYNMVAAKYGEQIEKEGIEQIKTKYSKDFEFGSSPDIINQMLDSGAKNVANEVHETLYNRSSDQYYNKHYKQLGNLLTSQYGQYTTVSPFYKAGGGTDQNPYPLIDGSGLDPTKIIVPMDETSGTMFDKITGRHETIFPYGLGGYYDPNDPNTFSTTTYEESIRERANIMKAPSVVGESNIIKEGGGGGGF